MVGTLLAAVLVWRARDFRLVDMLCAGWPLPENGSNYV